jgi:membrane-associated phospholipid phosphatase
MAGPILDEPYSLPGPQVEPSAAFWLTGPEQIEIPKIEEIERILKDQGVDPRYPGDATDEEFAELKLLERHRSDDLRRLPDSLSEFRRTSLFVQLQHLPFGTIYNVNKHDGRQSQDPIDNILQQDRRILFPPAVVLKGAELARMFEAETPGLIHRHAVNFLFYMRPDISPIRQARVWMALDASIYAALSAAWYFKWAAGEGVSYRWRPFEYADRNGEPFTILFDRVVDFDGSGDGPPRDMPQPSPGTPRHPAYPSGHSTFSAAASRILEYFFSPGTLRMSLDQIDAELAKIKLPPMPFEHPLFVGQQLRLLAQNIGFARLWAGVHWRSDHTFGQAVGSAAADAVIAKLRRDCIPSLEETMMDPPVPPDADELRAREEARRAGRCAVDQDVIPTKRPDPAALGIF